MNIEEILGTATKSYLKAIVYVSATGFTERYAQMLSEEVGIPAYTLLEASQHIKAGDEIIFMGWVNSHKVTGYKKASKLYKCIAVCAVGMSSYSFERTIEIRDENQIEDSEVFWLQGGYDVNKLPLPTKIVMKIGAKIILKALKRKAEAKGLSFDEQEAVEIHTYGGNFVSMENLLPVLDWINENYKIKKV